MTPGYPRRIIRSAIKDRTNSESVRKGFEAAVRAARTAKRAGFSIGWIQVNGAKCGFVLPRALTNSLKFVSLA